MISKANYSILLELPSLIVLKDIGPWDTYKTITNAAEKVVIEVATKTALHNKTRLAYYDSEGELTELKHKDGEFVGFGHFEDMEMDR